MRNIKDILTQLFVLFSFYAFTQNASDQINESSLNEKFLEHLIKEKIDEVRFQHGLKPLFNDSILYVAAKFHANYLFKKGALSHTEPENLITETPQKRADHFGAINYLVGENVAFTLINVPVRDKKNKIHTNTTYEETASDFVTMWVNSKGHYKNIITPDYNSTGLAIWIDEVSKKIYAVQKFANILFKYKFDENKSFFPYSNFKYEHIVSSFDEVDKHMHKGKHAYKLKQVKDSIEFHRLSEGGLDLTFGKTFITPKGDAIYLTSYNPEILFKMLKRRKDGFAAEIVTYNPFDCGNPKYYTLPSRRNQECIFNGRVLKPIYRKKALKGFKPGGEKRKDIKLKLEEGKVKKYYIKLGNLPKDIKDYSEVNLVVIQKKRVYKIMHFSSYCGDTLERFYKLPFHHDSIFNDSEIHEEYKNISFSIPFQKGKTEYKMSDIKPITDSLVNADFIADTIEIKSFSSIEGSEVINKKIQEERSHNIANAISSNQKEKLIKLIHSEENWVLFEKQIRESKELFEFKDLSHTKVKEKFEDTLTQSKFEKYLAKQRVAKIRLHAKEIINDKNIENYIFSLVKIIKKKIFRDINTNPNKNIKSKIDSMQFYMEITYNKIKEGVVKSEFFKNFDLDDKEIFIDYNLKKLKYKIQLLGIHQEDLDWARDVYGELVALYNKKEQSFFINYNMLNLIQLYGAQMNVFISESQQDAYINELMGFAVNNEEKEMVEKLALNFWFKICRLTLLEQPEDKKGLFMASLNKIYNYFKNKTLSTEEINKLAAYYLYHSKSDWVVELLWPQFEKRKNNPEGLKILAKTLYQNFEESGNKNYYEFLKEVYEIIGKDNWCPMFVGPCNISFQAFDYENFRNYYCEKCNGYLNYAKSPKKE